MPSDKDYKRLIELVVVMRGKQERLLHTKNRTPQHKVLLGETVRCQRAVDDLLAEFGFDVHDGGLP